MKLKVCGLTKTDQIHELISMKVDFLGFIFYEKSPRYVLNHLSLSQISGIKHSGKVGVFVNESVENIVAIAEDTALNYIQLHGDEEENFIDELRNKLNKEIKIICGITPTRLNLHLILIEKERKGSGHEFPFLKSIPFHNL